MSEPAHEPSAQALHESQATDTADEELLADLADDFAARLRRGEHPSVEEYTAEHPALAERIRKVLMAAAMMEQTRAWDVTAGPEAPGALIGRYKLLERIGEGGFGVVYMAEQQQPVRRKVALKVIKPGMDSRQVLARFDAERQALAIMDHPNIAKVFDAGATDSGRPYFVMELVRGVPITEFCDKNQLPPRERLGLFNQVCHAVQHAHQKGIIHRDIKPTNVLVVMHDTTPVVKVIDFGVAKALGQELTNKTLFTGFAQFLGTPLYMSPEQAGQSSLDVDTRSDIYSLGVLLYELLTGTTPFDKERFRTAAEDEIRRIIREEEPPKPSTRLSESKETLPSISAQRHTEPAKLTRLVRGELDWIVMKALEKERTRRYETANGFAADVQRYLQDEPVLACPPSSAYRLKKFARRNKATLLTASVIGVALLFAVGSFGWAVRDRAARHAKVTEQVELILTEVDQLEREQKWPEALAAVRQAEAAVASGEADAGTTERVRERLKDLEFVDRLEQIRMQKATWLRQRFDVAGVDREYARAFREYGVDVAALAVEASIERLKARPALVVPLAAALDEWLFNNMQVSEGDAGWKRLVAVARGIDPDPLRNRLRSAFGRPLSEVRDELRRLAESIDVRAHHPVTLNALVSGLVWAKHSDLALRLAQDAQSARPADFWVNYNLAHRLAARNDHEGAVRFYTAAVSIRPHAVAPRNNLGNALRSRGMLDEAIVCYRRVIELDPKFPFAYRNLGLVLLDQKKLDQAEAAFRTAIELDPKYALAHYSLGVVLEDHRKPDEAVAAYREAVRLEPANFAYICSLGHVLAGARQFDEAIVAYRQAVRVSPDELVGHQFLAEALRKAGHDEDEVIACYLELIELDSKNAMAYFSLGVARQNQGKLDEADIAFRTAARLDPKRHFVHLALGKVLYDQNKLDEAADAYRKAVELEPRFSYAHHSLGNVLLVQGKPEEATAAFRTAIELDPKNSTAYADLGVAFCKQGKSGEAITALGNAIELDPENAPGHNGLAWLLATCSDATLRDPGRAVALAERATELDPREGSYFNTLGAACYRAGDWKAAIDALEKSMELRAGGDGNDWFFLAMARCQLGDKDEARQWYDQAVEWMEKNDPANEELVRFRAEAANLLDVNKKKQAGSSTAPATANSQALKK